MKIAWFSLSKKSKKKDKGKPLENQQFRISFAEWTVTNGRDAGGKYGCEKSVATWWTASD